VSRVLYHIILEKRVVKFIKNLPNKHQSQVKKYILSFQENPLPHDSQSLKNYAPYRRGDCGEYRVIYRVDELEKIVYVLLVGKRNGGEVYKIMTGILG